MLVAGTFLLSAFCASIAITSAPSIELGRVTGRVTRNGQPMPNLWVDIGPINGGRPGEGFTNVDGWYELWYTSEKKGAWVGRHRAVIGRGGQVDDQGVPTPSIVMYSREIDVDHGDNVINFELPAVPDPEPAKTDAKESSTLTPEPAEAGPVQNE